MNQHEPSKAHHWLCCIVTRTRVSSLYVNHIATRLHFWLINIIWELCMFRVMLHRVNFRYHRTKTIFMMFCLLWYIVISIFIIVSVLLCHRPLVSLYLCICGKIFLISFSSVISFVILYFSFLLLLFYSKHQCFYYCPEANFRTLIYCYSLHLFRIHNTHE